MKNTFREAVARVLEVEEVGLETDFRQTPNWCSLFGFGLLVLLENDYGVPMNIQQFQSMRTVGDLYREVFVAFAAKVFKVDRARLSGESTYGSIPEWDSVNHLRLVMEAEQRFGTHYALEQIPELKSLNDFLI